MMTDVDVVEELNVKLAIAENALFRIASIRHCAVLAV